MKNVMRKFQVKQLKFFEDKEEGALQNKTIKKA
jgi:hypothetical protein